MDSISRPITIADYEQIKDGFIENIREICAQKYVEINQVTPISGVYIHIDLSDRERERRDAQDAVQLLIDAGVRQRPQDTAVLQCSIRKYFEDFSDQITRALYDFEENAHHCIHEMNIEFAPAAETNTLHVDIALHGRKGKVVMELIPFIVFSYPSQSAFQFPV